MAKNCEKQGHVWLNCEKQGLDITAVLYQEASYKLRTVMCVAIGWGEEAGAHFGRRRLAQ